MAAEAVEEAEETEEIERAEDGEAVTLHAVLDMLTKKLDTPGQSDM